jgi:hypothetical protein
LVAVAALQHTMLREGHGFLSALQGNKSTVTLLR